MASERTEREKPEGFDKPQGAIILDDSDNMVTVEVSEFNGKKYLSLRKWYQDREGFWRRGKGLSLSPPGRVIKLAEGLDAYIARKRRK